jgi:hypothetical protein
VRLVFLLLLLANFAFFAWSRYLSPADASADPQPLERQLSPEKLRIVPAAELAPAPAAKVAPAPIPAAVAFRCLEWGSFTLADAPRAEKALEPFSLGARLTPRRTEESAGWWVFIAPQPNRAGALKKAAELKALAVDDYFIVQEDGPNRWALSLGVFRSEESAQARLAALRAQGVRSAQVGARETTVPKVWLQVKDVDAPLAARLKDVARTMDGSDLRECVP